MEDKKMKKSAEATTRKESSAHPKDTMEWKKEWELEKQTEGLDALQGEAPRRGTLQGSRGDRDAGLQDAWRALSAGEAGRAHPVRRHGRARDGEDVPAHDEREE